jgi:hypothetical protein
MCLPVKPHAIEREWEHSGLKCAVVMNGEHGHRCGYVRVPPQHSQYAKDYSDVDVVVHGGLTFGAIEPCAHEDGTGFWFGFDCNHCDDASYEPGFEPPYWARYFSSSIKDSKQHWWTFAEVEAETERLAEQFAAIDKQLKAVGA